MRRNEGVRRTDRGTRGIYEGLSVKKLLLIIIREALAESRKEGPVYGRIPYEPRFLMILQVAKRITNVRFT